MQTKRLTTETRRYNKFVFSCRRPQFLSICLDMARKEAARSRRRQRQRQRRRRQQREHLISCSVCVLPAGAASQMRRMRNMRQRKTKWENTKKRQKEYKRQRERAREGCPAANYVVAAFEANATLTWASLILFVRFANRSALISSARLRLCVARRIRSRSDPFSSAAAAAAAASSRLVLSIRFCQLLSTSFGLIISRRSRLCLADFGNFMARIGIQRFIQSSLDICRQLA